MVPVYEDFLIVWHQGQLNQGLNTKYRTRVTTQSAQPLCGFNQQEKISIFLA